MAVFDFRVGRGTVHDIEQERRRDIFCAGDGEICEERKSIAAVHMDITDSVMYR